MDLASIYKSCGRQAVTSSPSAESEIAYHTLRFIDTLVVKYHH